MKTANTNQLKKSIKGSSSFVVLCFLFFLLHIKPVYAQSLGGLAIGQTAPDFTVTDMDGVQHHLYSYLAQGKYVMLKFGWLSCGSCVGSQASVNTFYKNYGKNECDVVVISIHIRDTRTDLQNYHNYLSTANPSLLAPGEEMAEYPEIPDSITNSPANTTPNEVIWNAYNFVAAVAFTLVGPDSTVVLDNTTLQNQQHQFFAQPFSVITTLENNFGLYGYYYANVLPGITSAQLDAKNGCEGLLNGPSGITDQQQVVEMQAWPNPTDHNISISWKKPLGNSATITVYDVLGQVVYTQPLQRAGVATSVTIAADAFPAGVYIAQINDGSQSGSIRFIRK